MREILGRMAGRRVFVIGDVCLDHYVFGRPQRVSREAPVLILDEQRQEYRLGGAAAPALALRELGCDVSVGGIIGSDPEGDVVAGLLAEKGIDTAPLTVDSTRPTTLKTRVVAEGFLLFPQQLVRVDRQVRDPVSQDIERHIARAVRSVKPDAVLISDYRSGVVTDMLVDHICDYRSVQGVLLTVDSQGELRRFPGFDLVKCNRSEAEAVVGEPLASRQVRESRLSELRAELNTACLVVTRGDEGASIVTAGSYAEVPAPNRSEVFDVTGAGDTVVAVMTAAMLAGASAVDAAQLGQAAAGIVVRKWGNAQASLDEIQAALSEVERG